jgi:hypothetical protein
LAPSLRQVI